MGKETIKKYQEDPYGEYLRKTKLAESGGNPNAKAKTSSASGLYQFTEGTWRDVSNKHNLGYTANDRFDPLKSEKAMRLFTQDNEKSLSPIVGRPLSDSERYLGHFLGVQGASNLLRANKQDPNMPLSHYISPKALEANRGVFYNKDGTVKTTQQLYDWADKKMNGEITYANNVSPYMNATTNVTDFAVPQISGNFEAVPDVYKEEVKKEEDTSESLAKLQEQSFLQDIQSLMKPAQQRQEQQQAAQQQTPQAEDIMATYQNISGFIDNPLAQEGALYVKSKNDPRYQAYQDSLKAYTFSKNLKSRVERTKQFPDAENNNKTTFPITGEGKSMLPKTRLEKLMSHPDSNPIREFSRYNEGTGESMRPIDVLKYPSDKWYSPVAGTLPMYKKPTQPVIIEKGIEKDFRPIYLSDPRDPRLNQYTEAGRQYLYQKPTQPILIQPRDKQIQLKGLSTQELAQQDNQIQAEIPNIRQQAQIPNSWNVDYSAQRVDGQTGYNNQNNPQNVSIESAIRAKEQADRQNAYWQEKYGNLDNPEAQRRLQELKDIVNITPNYQQGGIIKDNNGQWEYPGEITQISSPNITMKNVPYNVLGIADTGEQKMMHPNQEYNFSGAKTVTEYPQTTDKEKAFLKAMQQYKKQM